MVIELRRPTGSSEALPDRPVDLDVLRGWREVHDPALRAPHVLPALARLVCRGDDGGARASFGLHGPELYVGRFHPQYGPVDVVLNGLRDHEIYRLSAPHVRLTMSKRGEWRLRPVAPTARTEVNGEALGDTRETFPLADGDTILLGVTSFRFELGAASYDAWMEAKRERLLGFAQPSLHLVRAGGICGPHYLLDPDRPNVLGRSFPRPQEQHDPIWGDLEQPHWDLAGLDEWERKFIGFRHLLLEQVGDQWIVEPLSRRQRTFVNRVEIAGRRALMPGDELGLGSVIFHFHHPSDLHASTEARTAELPTVVNWQEEHTRPGLRPIPSTRDDDAGDDAGDDDGRDGGEAP